MKKWHWVILGLCIAGAVWQQQHAAEAATAVWSRPASSASATVSTTQVAALPDAASMALLRKSFAATHALVSGYIVHNYSTLNDRFQSVRELEQNGQRLQQEFGLLNAKLYSRDYGQERYVDIHGQLGSNTVVNVVLTSFAKPNGVENATASTVLVVSVDSTGTNLDQMQHLYTTIAQAVRKSGAIPELSACIEGNVGDRMSESKANALVNAALQSVQATRVEGLTTASLTSISAYSPLGGTFIMTNTKRMNLQVAVHADTYHHDTNVLVGTPIITTTY